MHNRPKRHKCIITGEVCYTFIVFASVVFTITNLVSAFSDMYSLSVRSIWVRYQQDHASYIIIRCKTFVKPGSQHWSLSSLVTEDHVNVDPSTHRPT